MIIFLKEYIMVGFYFLFSFIVASLLITLARFLGPLNLDNEKLSAYECGFEPFTSSRIRFDITFLLIAVLYLIFDLEIVILLPWVVFASQLGIVSFLNVLFFILLLLIGFITEWVRGGLNCGASHL